jgi:hypothetical protein
MDPLTRVDLLEAHGRTSVEAVTFKMGHALTSEPGVAAQPPIAEAVSVDAALTEWFREKFAVIPRRMPPTIPLGKASLHGSRPRLRAGGWTSAAPVLSSPISR